MLKTSFKNSLSKPLKSSLRTSFPSWIKLESLKATMSDLSLKGFFKEDSQRFERFSIRENGLLLDFSKNRINQTVFDGLMELAKESEVESWRDKMFAGEKINLTEQRAVLHTALRNQKGSKPPLDLDGNNIHKQVEEQLERVKNFSDSVRQKQWVGFTGKPIKQVVNIGIGGSNLGPKMVCTALKGEWDGEIKVHFVSNIDSAAIITTLESLDPEETLFIVSSKTFTTSETLENYETALMWMAEASQCHPDIRNHFIAVTAAPQKAKDKGFPQENIFEFWDWVGGRFSFWSAIGLPISLQFGFETFSQLLEGGEEMDQHFSDAPLERNMPVVLGLLSVWNTSFLGFQSQAILPYNQYLYEVPAYLQQAEMESNGKSTTWSGEQVDYPTVPIIWGQLGIDGQHAFYQFLHQSRTIIPVDFIAAINTGNAIDTHQQQLFANLFAQSQALMNGLDKEEVVKKLTDEGFNEEQINALLPHKLYSGNRPSNTILMENLNAKSLGALIALYEHKVFVQGIVLGICSFDQWGVELGKGLAKDLYEIIGSGDLDLLQPEQVNAGSKTSDSKKKELNALDSSTLNLVNFYKQTTFASNIS